IGNPLFVPGPTANDTVDTNVDLYDSTTSVTSSPSSSTSTTEPVTFTATIGTTGTPNGSATNRTGTVVFKDSLNAGPVTTSTCTGGNQNVSSNQATCVTSALANGSHAITAQYSGDGNFDPSNNNGTPFTQTVSKS